MLRTGLDGMIVGLRNIERAFVGERCEMRRFDSLVRSCPDPQIQAKQVPETHSCPSISLEDRAAVESGERGVVGGLERQDLVRCFLRSLVILFRYRVARRFELAFDEFVHLTIRRSPHAARSRSQQELSRTRAGVDIKSRDE